MGKAATARLTVRVSPGARRAELVGPHGDGWKLRVRAAPERGRANEELVLLLADTLGLERHAVRVVAGASGRDKIVELTGLTRDEVETRLLAVGRERN